MQPIRINLATFEYQDRQVAYPALLAAAVIVLVLSAYNIKAVLQNEAQITRYESKLVSLEQRQRIKTKSEQAQRPDFSRRDEEEILEAAEFVNALIDRDAFPWTGLLDVLEKSVPAGVTLTKLASSPDRDQILVEGRTRSMPGITRLVEGLEQTAAFSRNTLASLSVRPGEPSAAQEIEFHIESVIDRGRLLAGP